VALFKMANVKKVVKLKGVAKKWLCWYRLIAKNLITIIQVNFVLIPGEAGMRQHKLTCIVVTKIFAINLYHHSHFSAAPFNFTTFFHTGHFKQGRTFFCSWSVFE